MEQIKLLVVFIGPTPSSPELKPNPPQSFTFTPLGCIEAVHWLPDASKFGVENCLFGTKNAIQRSISSVKRAMDQWTDTPKSFPVVSPQSHFATSRFTAQSLRINLEKIKKTLTLFFLFLNFSARHRTSRIRAYSETKNSSQRILFMMKQNDL